MTPFLHLWLKSSLRGSWKKRDRGKQRDNAWLQVSEQPVWTLATMATGLSIMVMRRCRCCVICTVESNRALSLSFNTVQIHPCVYVLETTTQPVTSGRIRDCGDTRISEFHQREGEEVSGHQLGEWVLRQHHRLLRASARAHKDTWRRWRLSGLLWTESWPNSEELFSRGLS